MTQNEVDILKNSVLDATEAYVDARLEVLDYVKTQIGVVVGEPQKRADRKYYHTVRCNATSNTSGITYNNVLSVGNIPFPANSVVFLVAPNAQFSSQFILGKLDDTPCNITAGSITLGGDDPATAPIYLTGNPTDGVYGKIGGFKIYSDKLQVNDTLLSPNVIGCGKAGMGIINMVGGKGQGNAEYIQISNSGSPDTCLSGIRLYGNGRFVRYKGDGSVDWDRYVSLIPEHNLYYHSDNSVTWY